MIIRSPTAATVPVCVAKKWCSLQVHILPSNTPLLLARPDLEKWNVEVNYGQQSSRVDGVPVKPSRLPNGHYMINLFDDLQDAMNVTMLDIEDADDTTYIPWVHDHRRCVRHGV